MNSVTLAVAGGRKTQSIIDACTEPAADPDRLLALTYTRAGQTELRTRLDRASRPNPSPATTGWFAFLLRHWIRPYLPALFPTRRLLGLNFEGDPGQYAKDESRYLDSSGRAYRMHLAKLAFLVHEATNGAVLERLERVFCHIFIDEVQDLNGWDLEILDLLLASSIDVTMVGDVRQSLLETNPRDPKNSKYRSLGMMKWFWEREKKGIITLSHQTDTWRCNQAIANLADSIFANGAGFGPTESRSKENSDHHGLFTVDAGDLSDYLHHHSPACLRSSASTDPDGVLPYRNFGHVKGLTFDHVLITPTKPIRQFLDTGKQLADRSACGLYVAVTRARHSVAIVGPPIEGLNAWCPPRPQH